MSTDYQLLLQKFYNFKEYVKSVSKNDQVVKDYENMTDSEFLLFGLGYLVPNKKNIDVIIQQIVNKLKLTDPEQIQKIKRYIECFIEYLEQINNPDVVNTVIMNCAKEKNIPIPQSKSNS
jgi:hypothetical protein